MMTRHLSHDASNQLCERNPRLTAHDQAGLRSRSDSLQLQTHSVADQITPQYQPASDITRPRTRSVWCLHSLTQQNDSVRITHSIQITHSYQENERAKGRESVG